MGSATPPSQGEGPQSPQKYGTLWPYGLIETGQILYGNTCGGRFQQVMSTLVKMHDPCSNPGGNSIFKKNLDLLKADDINLESPPHRAKTNDHFELSLLTPLTATQSVNVSVIPKLNSLRSTSSQHSTLHRCSTNTRLLEGYHCSLTRTLGGLTSPFMSVLRSVWRSSAPWFSM